MQTAYNDQAIALPGQLGNLSPKKVSTLTSAARHGFGLAVTATSEVAGKLPAAATDITDMKKFRGVALKELSMENKKDGLPAGYEAKRPMSVMEKGEAYVVVTEDVTIASPVNVVFEAGADQGKFSGTTTADVSSLVPNARYKAASFTVDGVKIALVELY